MGAEPAFWVRVLLLDDVKQCTINGDYPFEVVDPQTQTRKARFDGADLPARVEVSAGKITIASRTLESNQALICPDEPYIFGLNGEQYRGKLKLIVNPDGSSFDAINIVPLEPYLAGVVGAEMYDYWEPEALKAQAIAARTYCLYIKRRFGQKRHWDLSATQANQVYAGVKNESAQVWDAVNITHGQVLVCTQSGGTQEIFPAYYSSICGGHTENSEHVFGDSFEPLRGVDCPYCKDVARLDLFFWPMAQFDQSDVTARLVQRYPELKSLGEIIDIKPAEQSDYGTYARLTLVKLFGSTGKSHLLRAENLRLAIDPTGRKLKSTICLIVKWDGGFPQGGVPKWAFLAGRGWGHGVGMCQHGAEGLARQGKTARAILQHYYPGSKITRFYGGN
jgi:stage II sporulation protein D